MSNSSEEPWEISRIVRTIYVHFEKEINRRPLQHLSHPIPDCRTSPCFPSARLERNPTIVLANPADNLPSSIRRPIINKKNQCVVKHATEAADKRLNILRLIVHRDNHRNHGSIVSHGTICP